jgi:AraC family transcriptional regulator of adaptative response / DNA-3-methyladenine glycosylase II
MYGRVLASDPDFNGRFFFGVLSTGIFCLPSCHARKPRVENVRFFPTAEAARAAGLRPCRKCHPEDFARGADVVLETIEAVVAEVRAHPGEFADARAVVRRSGFGATRAFELFRQHYHTTPAELVLRARLDWVKDKLSTSDVPLTEVAGEAGFQALSAFHENFRRLNGLTPTAWRELRSAQAFEVTLPEGYPLGYLRRALTRDPHTVTERLAGDIYTAAMRLGDMPARLVLRISERAVQVEISHGSALEAHRRVAGLLGLGQDAAGFSRRAERLGLGRLVRGREELRISQVTSEFDGLLWSIIGQQINFPFACLLRRRLFERAGEPLGDGLYAPPTPAAVAALTVDDLSPLQFSRQKARYLVDAARLVATGALDLESLRGMSATRAERTLLAVRGLGPWSVNYLMMRALGFGDCVPLGDTGVTSGLHTLFQLDERPDIDATRRLMSAFSPYRSLATAHLWQLHQPIPV